MPRWILRHFFFLCHVERHLVFIHLTMENKDKMSPSVCTLSKVWGQTHNLNCNPLTVHTVAKLLHEINPGPWMSLRLKNYAKSKFHPVTLS